PERVAIRGGSYGGYAVLAGLTFEPETFACDVDFAGPSNLVTFLNTIPPYWAPQIEMFAARVGDHRTDAGRVFLGERSPINFVDQINRPLLIGQGANDPRVNQAESDQIVAAMEERGIPVTYVVYPDEGHGFAKPTNNIAFNAITENFLASCLGGRAEPIGDTLGASTAEIVTGAEYVEGLEAQAGG
ncbi:MAG: prolyl oligopeptidase family serine peptidase, partial [Erythrobacter sp.]|nr:prolyl oligopeptidase family serine peptidase [Erythrobacter sp.]